MGMLKTEYLIIGGGCNGASIAYHLARLDAKNVTLVERRTLASGGTGLSSAIVRLHYSTEDTAKLALNSFRFFRRFKEETGIDSGLRQVGFLVLAGKDEEEGLRETVRMQRSLGVNTSVIGPDELKSLEPAI